MVDCFRVDWGWNGIVCDFQSVFSLGWVINTSFFFRILCSSLYDSFVFVLLVNGSLFEERRRQRVRWTCMVLQARSCLTCGRWTPYPNRYWFFRNFLLWSRDMRKSTLSIWELVESFRYIFCIQDEWNYQGIEGIYWGFIIEELRAKASIHQDEQLACRFMQAIKPKSRFQNSSNLDWPRLPADLRQTSRPRTTQHLMLSYIWVLSSHKCL